MAKKLDAESKKKGKKSIKVKENPAEERKK